MSGLQVGGGRLPVPGAGALGLPEYPGGSHGGTVQTGRAVGVLALLPHARVGLLPSQCLAVPAPLPPDSRPGYT